MRGIATLAGLCTVETLTSRILVFFHVFKSLERLPKLATSYISNAPASTPFRTLVWLSGIRWAVEQCFEEGKTELGMAHYEVRKYAGWQHHMLLTMLAHFFLWHLKGRLGEKSASTNGVAAAPAIPSRVAPAYRYD